MLRGLLLSISILLCCTMTGHSLQDKVLDYHFDEGEGMVLRNAASPDYQGQITSPVWVRNRHRNGLRFDGKQTYVEIRKAENLRLGGEFSLDCWFNTDSTPGGNPSALAVKDGAFRLLVYPTEQQFLLHLLGSKAGQSLYETVKTPISVGQWHHVALVYSEAGQTAWLYLDGKSVFREKADLGSLSESASPMRIGLGVSPEQKRYFKGTMAGLRLWGRALSQEEIGGIMKDEQPALSSKFHGDEDLLPRLPAAAPLEVGSSKQLFIDERFMEAKKNVSLMMNRPRRLGPVVLPDQPWESSEIGFCSSVLEFEGEYRVYYRATSKEAGAFVCLATSKDGEHWGKPNLGLVEFQGSKANNILFGDVGEATVFFDPNGKPDARFKALCVLNWPDPERGGLYVYTSPDGLRWKASSDRVFPLVPDTANQAAWDTRLRKYVAYLRVWNPMRKVGRVEMEDILKPWPYDRSVKPYHIWGEDKVPVTSVEIPTVFGYDEQDPAPSDHYNAAAVEYPWAADSYFMFPSAYYHFPEPPIGKYGNDGLLDIQMAVSR
ncbi:MAG: hypothetical protein HY318_16015, partial [Armatimonadetes bacterium]|nr:hypothetical protein [Armatimonadota bacterium]